MRNVGLGFTGHRAPLENGLVDMRGRFYNPLAARFMSPDPLVTQPYDAQAYNRYAYAFNRPFAYTDPSGFANEGVDPGSDSGFGNDTGDDAGVELVFDAYRIVYVGDPKPVNGVFEGGAGAPAPPEVMNAGSFGVGGGVRSPVRDFLREPMLAMREAGRGAGSARYGAAGQLSKCSGWDISCGVAAFDQQAQAWRRRGRDAQQTMLPLLEHHAVGVRLWAASHALEFCSERGEPVLEALERDVKGLLGFDASMTLEAWRAGTLRFP